MISVVPMSSLSVLVFLFLIVGSYDATICNVDAFVVVSSPQRSLATKDYASKTELLMSIPNPIDTLTSGLVSICRLPNGVTVRDGIYNENDSENDKQNSKITIKVLYDIENSLPCRKVRELITELDLSIDAVVPACKKSIIFTDSTNMYALDNKDVVIPRMIISDNENDSTTTLSGDVEIISYLKEKFNIQDDDESNMTQQQQIIKVLREVGGYVSILLRIGRGMDVSAAAAAGIGATKTKPKIPLILYSYEGNQFCRLVREVLTELDIVYTLKSCGKGSYRRNELMSLRSDEKSSSSQCPYLIDPNTNQQLSESSDIIKYLYTTYGTFVPPNELLQFTSQYVMALAKPIFTILTPIQSGSTFIDSIEYENKLTIAKNIIQKEINSDTVVVYTYKLSPFSIETLALLNNMNIQYTEISLGYEWIPGLIEPDNGSDKRTVLLQLTGQSSLPHIFINGISIGGLFSGTPGLVPAFEQNIVFTMINNKNINTEKNNNEQQQQSSSSTTTEPLEVTTDIQ